MMEKLEVANRAKVLFKRIQKDLDNNISEEKCNQYIQDVENIKRTLCDNDLSFAEDLDELDEVGGMFSDASKKEIKDALKAAEKQLDRILVNLGIDIDEVIETKKESGININVNPSFNQSQHQSQNQMQSVNFDLLIKEFEEELKKSRPDKSKLRSLMEKMWGYGKEHAIEIVNLILNVLKK